MMKLDNVIIHIMVKKRFNESRHTSKDDKIAHQVGQKPKQHFLIDICTHFNKQNVLYKYGETDREGGGATDCITRVGDGDCPNSYCFFSESKFELLVIITFWTGIRCTTCNA